MAKWDSGQYLKFNEERTRPAIDLLLKSGAENPRKILDIGCGPGNSTEVIEQRYPGAEILGIDSSEDMISKARQSCCGASFRLCDVAKELNTLDTDYDLVFSNACLQWIEDHERLIPKLLGLVGPGGTLAVQVPMNGASPLYKAIEQVAAAAKWGFRSVELEANGVLAPEQYFDILAEHSSSFEMWETSYYHRMRTHDDLVNWVKGTRLRPYLSALDAAGQSEFLAEITELAKRSYPKQANGEIIFKFRRFFFTAKPL